MICVQSACGAEQFSLVRWRFVSTERIRWGVDGSTELYLVNQPGIALAVAGSAVLAALRDATRLAPGSHRPR
ncbi:MAG: hypothetical protein RIS70_4420 [Planctomycetota bacterium]